MGDLHGLHGADILQCKVSFTSQLVTNLSRKAGAPLEFLSLSLLQQGRMPQRGHLLPLAMVAGLGLQDTRVGPELVGEEPMSTRSALGNHIDYTYPSLGICHSECFSFAVE